MANKKISQLDAATTLAVADLLAIVQNTTSTTKKITAENALKVVSALAAITSLPQADTLLVIQASGDPKRILVSNAVREKLLAARTYYVRIDGNDGNTGLVDSAGGAFLTIQRAVDVIAMLDINSQTVTVQVRDGTYTGTVSLKNVVGFAAPGNLVIQGNAGTPANVIISTTSANCFSSIGLTAVWDIKDMRLQTTTSGHCLYTENSSNLRYSNIDFGACANYHVYSNDRAVTTQIGNCTISAGAQIHIRANNNSLLKTTTRTLTFTADMNFSIEFALAGNSSHLDSTSMTFTLGGHTITGTRYAVSANSVINTGGGGANYFPGDAAGSSATGGQYI